MTETQSHILELFRAFSPDERDALLPQLVEAAEGDPDDLTADDIAAIEEGIAQAERGEVEDGEVVLNRIAARYNLPRA
jgi:predicted transcriptional regulator